MRFFEVDSAVDAIMSAAMVAQGRASQMNKQGKLSMNGFLQMLANSDVVMDYDGFKTVFDTNPALQNVIAKFDKDTITFKGDSDDEGEGYEEPETDMPDDERVSKMAKRAMKTREFVEDYEVLPKMDRDKYQKRDGLEGPIMTRSGKVVYYDPKKGDYYDPDTDMYLSYDDYKMLDKKANEAELPPHLAKMFGKDGKQVDTRTDVMKQMRDIVANKQASKVKFGDGDQMIDMYTASVLTQIYDKVNDNSKEAIIQRIGTIEKFNKLMPKLFGMLGEGSSPYKKGTKKYKAHMAAMHAGESVNEAWQAFKEGAPKMKYALVGTDMKIYAIGSDERDLRLDRRSLDKRFPDAAPLKMARLKTAQRIGDKVGSDQIKEGIKKGRPATGKDKIPDPTEVSLKKRIAKHVEDGLTRREVVAAYPDYDPNDIARLYDNEKALQDFEAGAKEMFGDVERKPSKKLSLTKERSLTSAEKDKMKHYEKKLPKQDFIDRYGKKEGEAIYYATATKMAKKNA